MGRYHRVPSLIAELRQRIYRTYNLIVIDADAFDFGPQNFNLLGNISYKDLERKPSIAIRASILVTSASDIRKLIFTVLFSFTFLSPLKQ